MANRYNIQREYYIGKFTVFASLLLLFGSFSLRFGEATPGEFNYNGVYNDS